MVIERWHRRKVLRTSGSALVSGGLAGCLSNEASDDEGGDGDAVTASSPDDERD